jgi:parallel beta-helix repeat protein
MCRGKEVWRTVGALAAVAVSLAVAPGAQAAKPVHVSCGETITADTTLANDLTNCPGHGLLIGADRIRLDLNGHTVDGDGAGDDAGIYNAAGHGGVTIEGGTVRDFSDGVLVQHASGNRVRNLRTSGNRHMGINLGRSARSSVERNASIRDAGGILVSDSRNVTVANNSVSDNQLHAAIPIFASSHVRVTQNTVRRSAMGSPISLLDNSDHNRVERNSISDSGDGVFLAEDADHNRVTGNSISDSRFQGSSSARARTTTW